jgi:hypothetical protein
MRILWHRRRRWRRCEGLQRRRRRRCAGAQRHPRRARRKRDSIREGGVGLDRWSLLGLEHVSKDPFALAAETAFLRGSAAALASERCGCGSRGGDFTRLSLSHGLFRHGGRQWLPAGATELAIGQSVSLAVVAGHNASLGPIGTGPHPSTGKRPATCRAAPPACWDVKLCESVGERPSRRALPLEKPTVRGWQTSSVACGRVLPGCPTVNARARQLATPLPPDRSGWRG